MKGGKVKGGKVSVEDCPAYGLADFEHIDEAGEEEVDGGKDPKGKDFLAAVGERCSHTLDADVCVEPPCGGENAAYGFPQWWNGCARPTDAGEEEQWYGHKDEEEDAVLTAIDEAAVEHCHVGAGEQIGDKESEEVGEMSELGESKPSRDADGHVECHEHEE